MATPAAATGFEDLVALAKSALPDTSKDPSGKAAELVAMYRSYLQAVRPGDREAPLLAAARHALRCARESGRPSVGGYACKTVMGTMVPKLMELCCSEMPPYEAVNAPYHDNGLFANVLQVYDALLLSRPGAKVLVDWRRKGTEGHFQYGPAGFDLWAHLFEPCERCASAAVCPGGAAPEAALLLRGRVSPVFMNLLRGYLWTLPAEDLAALRRAYAAAAGDLRPRFGLLQRVEDVCARWGQGAYVVGVHKRLGTPEVAACQLSQRAPSSEEFAARARAAALAGAGPGERPVVFLATDDALAAAAFEAAFPPAGEVELCLRGGVKRTEGGVREDGVDNEVHRAPCAALDAEDALVDALCLTRCRELVCMDSNLSIFAALTSPGLRLQALNSVLPEGWEEAAAQPEEAVAEAYRVAFKPMVFVRAGPSAATELLGARKHGEIVRTTGRAFEGWVEIQGGGWMLVDAERQAQGRGQGLLLVPEAPAAAAA